MRCEHGFATSSTDTGHVGRHAEFALEPSENIVDFGWRSEHEMTVKAKAIIEAFYGSAPSLVLEWLLDGGRQGLQEAQTLSRTITTASSPAHQPTTGLT